MLYEKVTYQDNRQNICLISPCLRLLLIYFSCGTPRGRSEIPAVDFPSGECSVCRGLGHPMLGSDAGSGVYKQDYGSAFHRACSHDPLWFLVFGSLVRNLSLQRTQKNEHGSPILLELRKANLPRGEEGSK